MNVLLPLPGDRYDAQHARELVNQLTQSFTRVVSTESASPYVLLTSPNGSVWKVTVSDTGALTVTSMPLGRQL